MRHLLREGAALAVHPMPILSMMILDPSPLCVGSVQGPYDPLHTHIVWGVLYMDSIFLVTVLFHDRGYLQQIYSGKGCAARAGAPRGRAGRRALREGDGVLRSARGAGARGACRAGAETRVTRGSRDA